MEKKGKKKMGECAKGGGNKQKSTLACREPTHIKKYIVGIVDKERKWRVERELFEGRRLWDPSQ